MTDKSENILLVGSGMMAVEYARVLTSMGKKYIVVGRGSKSADFFQKTTGITVYLGGIESWINQKHTFDCYQNAIVAVSEEELGKTVLALIKCGVKRILVEKPGGSVFGEIRKIASEAKKRKISVYVGYNRRFYLSVFKAEDIIKKDGGLISLKFDFTERSHIISKLKKDAEVKDNWFIHNSSHVIDLAFYFGGWPQYFSTYTSGSLPWHTKAAAFCGSGVTDKKVLFSYHANWQSPGNWSIELLTKSHHLILNPLEKLKLMDKKGNITDMKFEDTLDQQFKPGLYRQVESFLTNKTERLCDINKQVNHLDKYYKFIKPSND